MRHGVWRFLAAHERLDAGRGGGSDQRWELRAHDIVMVDEASMVSTANLDAIRARVEKAGARLVLTGDPRQLPSIKAGGVMGLLDGHAATYHLAEVRRFTEDWERGASLRLRAGDPDALLDYERHARLTQADTIDDAITSAATAAVADRLDGRTTLGVADTNDQAAAVAARVRARLVDLGRVQADGVRLGRDGNTAGIGDLISCRRIDHDLGVINRAQYEVLEAHDDGSLTVRPVNALTPGALADTRDAVHLPTHYVTDDVQLAYASTIHAAQGMTVDAAHLVTDGKLDPSGLYVGMTRGRLRNTAPTSPPPGRPSASPRSGSPRPT